MSESTLQSAIVTALRALGLTVHVNTAGHRGKGRVRAPYGAGCPDLMVFCTPDGRPLFLETKVPKTGVLSEAQIAWHEMARRWCIDVRVVRSLDDAMEAVKFARGPRQTMTLAEYIRQYATPMGPRLATPPPRTSGAPPSPRPRCAQGEAPASPPLGRTAHSRTPRASARAPEGAAEGAGSGGG